MTPRGSRHRNVILRRRAAFISASLTALSGCGPGRHSAGPTAVASASTTGSTVPATDSPSSALPSANEPAAPRGAEPSTAVSTGPAARASSSTPPVTFQVCLSIVHPPKVMFSRGGLALNEDAKAALDEVARLLRDHPHVRVEVQGHVGSSEPLYGRSIGRDRAELARQYLLDRGIAADRLCARSYGESRPLTLGKTERQREANRRVEFRLLDADESCTK